MGGGGVKNHHSSKAPVLKKPKKEFLKSTFIIKVDLWDSLYKLYNESQRSTLCTYKLMDNTPENILQQFFAVHFKKCKHPDGKQ